MITDKIGMTFKYPTMGIQNMEKMNLDVNVRDYI